jgi:ketosteroid isomerase-like protein
VTAPQAAVVSFNDCITARDLPALAALMTDDHVFIDTEDSAVRGKVACVAAWKGFFAAFPDYRNVFEQMSTRGESVVVAGRSECSDARLNGAVLWSANVRDGLIAEWRVYEDNDANRAALSV